MTENHGGSCDPCKRKKCKCDRRMPSCRQCDVSKVDCTYDETKTSKRGIPGGYLGLLEQRLADTEVLLYNALSEIHASKYQVASPSGSRLLAIPDAIPREVNASKQARMEEWREYPLQTPQGVERWRQFLGSSNSVSTTYTRSSEEPSQPRHLEAQKPPPNQSFSADIDIDGQLADPDIEFSASNGFMEVSQSQNQSRIQNRNRRSMRNSPSRSPPHTSTISVQPLGLPNILHQNQLSFDEAHTTNYPTAENMAASQGIRSGDQRFHNAWETSSPGSSRQQTALQNSTGLVQSQQLSAAFKNTYY